jgi:hypothetical protein
MKPLHVGLLLVGVALMGGLAVKLTQAPPIPVTAPPVLPAVPAASPAVVVTKKPSPIPTITPPAPVRTAAPEPVFDQPPPPQPAIRKSKPISIAQATPIQQVKPTQWTPGRYEAPAQPIAAKPLVAKPAPATPEPPKPEAAKPEAAKSEANMPRHVTLQPGTMIPVRLDQSLTSDSFQASLAEPLAVDGLVIAEKGARVNVRPGLASLMTSDGQRVAISTDPWTKPTQPGAGAVVRFRVASRLTIIERQVP